MFSYTLKNMSVLNMRERIRMCHSFLMSLLKPKE